MSVGHSEFPAASYDAWKTRSPDDDRFDDDYDPREDCDHADFDVDFEGRADCPTCGHTWRLTAEQLESYDRLQERLQRDWERTQRRERNPLWRALRWLKARWYCWRHPLPKIDDEIPF